MGVWFVAASWAAYSGIPFASFLPPSTLLAWAGAVVVALVVLVLVLGGVAAIYSSAVACGLRPVVTVRPRPAGVEIWAGSGRRRGKRIVAGYGSTVEARSGTHLGHTSNLGWSLRADTWSLSAGAWDEVQGSYDPRLQSVDDLLAQLSEALAPHGVELAWPDAAD